MCRKLMEKVGNLTQSADTIRRAIARGDLKAYRLGSSRVIRIKPRDLEKFMRPVTPLAGEQR